MAKDRKDPYKYISGTYGSGTKEKWQVHISINVDVSEIPPSKSAEGLYKAVDDFIAEWLQKR